VPEGEREGREASHGAIPEERHSGEEEIVEVSLAA
jgi:hypothetical protein